MTPPHTQPREEQLFHSVGNISNLEAGREKGRERYRERERGPEKGREVQRE